MTRKDIEELHRLMQSCFRHDGPYHLSSGLVSDYYYDGKLGTLHPPTVWLAANVLVGPVIASGAEAVGGRATGSIPISDAVGIAAHLQGYFLPSFFVREEAKTHGTKSEVAQAHFNGEELLTPGRRLAIVDNVITTGRSIEEAIKAVENKGCVVTAVYTLVERHESDGAALRGRSHPIMRIFYTDEDGTLFIDEEFVRRAEEAAQSRVLSR